MATFYILAFFSLWASVATLFKSKLEPGSPLLFAIFLLLVGNQVDQSLPLAESQADQKHEYNFEVDDGNREPNAMTKKVVQDSGPQVPQSALEEAEALRVRVPPDVLEKVKARRERELERLPVTRE